jgi:hypothetical protein
MYRDNQSPGLCRIGPWRDPAGPGRGVLQRADLEILTFPTGACFGDRLSVRRDAGVALVRAASASAIPGISRIGAVTALL